MKCILFLDKTVGVRDYTIFINSLQKERNLFVKSMLHDKRSIRTSTPSECIIISSVPGFSAYGFIKNIKDLFSKQLCRTVPYYLLNVFIIYNSIPMCINGTVGFNKSNDQISNIKAVPIVIDFLSFFLLLSHLIHIS